MSALVRKLSARYQSAESRVDAVEAEIRRASEIRLAELMKLPPRRRLKQIEDPALTTADRLKLRRSIAGHLRHRKQYALLFGSRFVLTRLRGWLRYAPRALAVTAVIVPLVLVVNRARNNTDEVITLSYPIDPDWRLPSGVTEHKPMPAGARLAIARQSGSAAIARRWVEGQGYATARILMVWTSTR